jgi:hypothetical protein
MSEVFATMRGMQKAAAIPHPRFIGEYPRRFSMDVAREIFNRQLISHQELLQQLKEEDQ